jgi:hypothetical protein
MLIDGLSFTCLQIHLNPRLLSVHLLYFFTFYANFWCLDEIQHFRDANILTPYPKCFPTSLKTSQSDHLPQSYQFWLWTVYPYTLTRTHCKKIGLFKYNEGSIPSNDFFYLFF